MVSLSKANRDLLGELYRRTARTVDELPYTEEFESLYTAFIARSGLIMTRHDVWQALPNLRKASKLARKKR